MKNSLYKGTLKNIILKLLQENDKMYGYQMTRSAQALTQGELTITEGALYPLLHKLENDGLIISEIQKIKGRPRKYYTLSDKGKKMQSNYERDMISYIHNLKNIFGV